jgi:hypothetical protein
MDLTRNVYFPFAMSRIENFFFICAGVNREMLKKCPSEKSKYAGLGAAIFFTGLFAFFSSSFALYTVFEEYVVSIVLGLLWGLMIFNLDRYIVSSMRKEGRWKKEFLAALPRIIVAVVISIVIAKPLELRIFQKEIEPELTVMEQEAFASQEHAVKIRFAGTDSLLRNDLARLKQQIEEKAGQRDVLVQRAQEEADGTGGSRRRNTGPIYKLKKADAENAERELSELKAINQKSIDELERKLSDNDAARRKELADMQFVKRNGLAARLEALANLKQKSAPIYFAGLFLMLLFIALETVPVFVKLISPKGPYDNLLRIEEFTFSTNESGYVAEASGQARTKGKDLPQEENEFLHDRLDQALKKA